MLYKNIHLICWLFLCPFLAMSQNTVVLSGGSLVQTGGQMVIKDGSLVNDASINQLSGALKLSGTATDAQSQIGGTSATTLFNLEIAKLANNATLGQNVSVNNNLQFSGGLLDILNADLTMAAGATFSGVNDSRYVRTSSSGQLLLTLDNNSQLIPVGNSLYNPLTAINAGSADVYGIRVMDMLLEEANMGNAFTADGVGVSWKISEMAAGGSDLSLTFQWNGSQELTGFDRTDMAAMRFNGAFWNLQDMPGMASGGDPYQFMAGSITETGIFGLFDAALPDLDGDGFGSASDCDDDNPDVNPDATEICNGIDDNCNTLVDIDDPELVDNTPPMAVCQDLTVQLNPEGEVSITPEEVDDGSSDNCSVALSLDVDEFFCEDLGSNTVTLTVTDAGGNTDNCTASILVESNEGLPNGWQSTDIGNTTLGNEYEFDPCANPNPADGDFAITGSGNNATSSTTDNVAFASQTLCGDGMITAKIESVTPNGYGGLMIRETTAAGSKQVSVFSNLTNILRHEVRYSTNGPKQVSSFYKPFPIWLRIQRQGNWIFAYYSNNGSSFQYVHGVFVPMQSCVEIGLVSFTYLPNAQTEAVFSNVSIMGSNGALADDNGTHAINRVPPKINRVPNEGPLHLSIYPNPTSQAFTLTFDNPLEQPTTLQLYNTFGQLVEEQRMEAGNVNLEWQVNHLPEGMYWIYNERNQVRKQVVIARE